MNLKYGSISKKLGKNHAYIHQYITRGVPEELPYEIRLPLAALLGWDEKDLRVNEITMPFGGFGGMPPTPGSLEEKKTAKYLPPAQSSAKKSRELPDPRNIDPGLVFEAAQITNGIAREYGLSASRVKTIVLEAAEIASIKNSVVTKNLILYLIEISKEK
jgi:hypothetical protein